MGSTGIVRGGVRQDRQRREEGGGDGDGGGEEVEREGVAVNRGVGGLGW